MDSVSEDWLMEIDTLQSVFMDQLKLKENSTIIELSLWPNPDSKDENLNQVGLVYEITYKSGYPNVLPDMMVRPLKGVASKQAKELLDKLSEQANDMLGMQMLYPLAQFLKDWLDEKNTDSLTKQKDAARAKDELEAEKEREEYSRRYKDGTTVTSENFKAWFISFLGKHPEKPQWPADYPQALAASSSSVGSATSQPAPVTKFTGRQIFEKASLSGIDLSSLVAASPSPAPTGNNANVDWELFDGAEDLPEDE